MNWAGVALVVVVAAGLIACDSAPKEARYVGPRPDRASPEDLESGVASVDALATNWEVEAPAWSPLGAHQAFTLVANAADDDSLEQTLTALHAGDLDRDALTRFHRSLLDAIPESPRSAIFTVWPILLDRRFPGEMQAKLEARVERLGSAGLGATRSLVQWYERTAPAIEPPFEGLTTEESLLLLSVAELRVELAPAGEGWVALPGPVEQGAAENGMVYRSPINDQFELYLATGKGTRTGFFADADYRPMEGRMAIPVLDVRWGGSLAEASAAPLLFRGPNVFKRMSVELSGAYAFTLFRQDVAVQLIPGPVKAVADATRLEGASRWWIRHRESGALVFAGSLDSG